jgi:hypothetical protein
MGGEVVGGPFTIHHFPLPDGPWPHPCPLRPPSMSSFATYVIGFIILVVGLAIAAYLLDVPTVWILVGVIVALGIGVITATSRTKMKDPPGTS